MLIKLRAHMKQPLIASGRSSENMKVCVCVFVHLHRHQRGIMSVKGRTAAGNIALDQS